MAEDDVVQSVEIQGADAAAADFIKIGDAAEEGFGKVSASAARANESLAQVGDAAADASQKTSSGLKEAGDGATHLKKVEAAAFDMGAALRDVGSAAASFVTRVSAIGAGALAAVGGIMALARSVAAATSTQTDGTQSARQLTQSIRASSQVLTQMKVAAVQNARSISDLNDQYASGKIKIGDYVKQLAELRKKQQQDAEDQKRIAAIQRQAREEENKTIQKARKAQEARAAQADLVKKFGADLTASLIRLGNASDSFWRRFLSGPSILARGVDAITQLLQRNGDAILGFYDRISRAIGSIFDTGDTADTIDFLSNKFQKFGEDVTTLIEQVIVPAIKLFLSVMDSIAGVINKIFGTNLSGQALVVLLILAKLTGAFKLLWTVIRVGFLAIRLIAVAFGGWGLVIAAIIVALIWLATKIDWAKLGQAASKAVDDVVKWFQALPGRILGFFSDLWNSITQFFSDGWATIAQLGADAVQLVIDAWNSVVQFFTDLWDGIVQLASDAWDSIVQFASDTAQQLQDAWNAIIQFFTDLWNQIKQLASDAWTGIVQLATDGVQLIIDAWNATVQFFTDLWASIVQLATDAWNNITSTIDSAVQSIIGFFQPLIEILKSIWDWAKKAGDALTGTGTAAAEAEGLRGGGEVHGPGTSTSDSVWAKLSRGEFVVRAAAVQRYGVAFMHAINQMRANVPRFNMGGLVDAMQMPLVPHLAAGGLISNNVTGSHGRPIILNIGDESFSLIALEQNTADRLGRYATKRRLGSAGRKPSYYGA